ncbi:cell wall-binding repeat-containing protein [Halalkalibacter akibai]|uniref:N-acetylmuramoyl-L-alanine amidase n=1 Tax=Halalkalibacter akibai (strain ATCC 43226 / DSM 21942 / CIP 109018 / JCM 9157 / 1139) TaxID=1236973 RepID=W4QWV7_HALA3|nr:cell wall-binding repeat-containing protein [Halalkalibacter akibai]GAE35804.1 N-acetylmuramoyl-L-alanine amidase [Halalkalibacter akibai JCM 9157]
MPKEIYIAGGTAAISAAIEREIRAMGFSVKRIGGQNRFDTAVQIATEVGVANQIFLTTANEQSPDALSIAPYAGLKQIPILLTRRDQLSKTVVDFIVRNNINHVTLIGGTQAISDQIREQLSALNVRTIERISGDTRFGTSVKIAERYASDFDFSNISIASGRSFIDALPGSPYASMQKAPILLTDRTRLPMEVRSWMEQQRLSRTTFTFLGGYGVITDEVRKEFLY